MGRLNFYIPNGILKEVEGAVSEYGYASKSELCREAIREKLNRLKYMHDEEHQKRLEKKWERMKE